MNDAANNIFAKKKHDPWSLNVDQRADRKYSPQGAKKIAKPIREEPKRWHILLAHKLQILVQSPKERVESKNFTTLCHHVEELDRTFMAYYLSSGKIIFYERIGKK